MSKYDDVRNALNYLQIAIYQPQDSSMSALHAIGHVRQAVTALERENRASAELALEADLEWTRVADSLPEPGRIVLAAYLNSQGNPRVIRAMLVLAFTVESSPDSDMGVYSEEQDAFFNPGGWYECIENWSDFGSVLVDADITHWRPISKHPETMI